VAGAQHTEGGERVIWMGQCLDKSMGLQVEGTLGGVALAAGQKVIDEPPGLPASCTQTLVQGTMLNLQYRPARPPPRLLPPHSRLNLQSHRRGGQNRQQAKPSGGDFYCESPVPPGL
jgi:hypothetical protein